MPDQRRQCHLLLPLLLHPAVTLSWRRLSCLLARLQRCHPHG
jgi:hypothetical protein